MKLLAARAAGRRLGPSRGSMAQLGAAATYSAAEPAAATRSRLEELSVLVAWSPPSRSAQPGAQARWCCGEG